LRYSMDFLDKQNLLEAIEHFNWHR
jgi:hypothetical protein